MAEALALSPPNACIRRHRRCLAVQGKKWSGMRRFDGAISDLHSFDGRHVVVLVHAFRGRPQIGSDLCQGAAHVDAAHSPKTQHSLKLHSSRRIGLIDGALASAPSSTPKRQINAASTGPTWNFSTHPHLCPEHHPPSRACRRTPVVPTERARCRVVYDETRTCRTAAEEKNRRGGQGHV